MLKDRTQQFEHHSAMLQQQAILFNKIVKLFLPFLHYHQADNPSLSFSRSSPRLILIVMKAQFYLCCAVSFCLFLSSNLCVNILRSISTHNRLNLTYYKSKCFFYLPFQVNELENKLTTEGRNQGFQMLQQKVLSVSILSFYVVHEQNVVLQIVYTSGSLQLLIFSPYMLMTDQRA